MAQPPRGDSRAKHLRRQRRRLPRAVLYFKDQSVTPCPQKWKRVGSRSAEFQV